VSEDEIETLENYLDGALPVNEAEAVAGRLATEPSLAAALEKLLAQRTARQAVWRTLEPDPASADALGRRAAADAVRRDRLARTSRTARRASAIAACIALSFAGGWFARGRAPAPLRSEVTAAAAAVPDGPFQVALTDESGNIIAVQHFTDPRKAREFAEDVGRWQSRPRRTERREFLQTSDEF
jgi:anti-sigma factor RsiW